MERIPNLDIVTPVMEIPVLPGRDGLRGWLGLIAFKRAVKESTKI